jgi:hypothetical protein
VILVKVPPVPVVLLCHWKVGVGVPVAAAIKDVVPEVAQTVVLVGLVVITAPAKSCIVMVLEAEAVPVGTKHVVPKLKLLNVIDARLMVFKGVAPGATSAVMYI